MKVDYSLTPQEQVNIMKLMIAELSAYWKSRAANLKSPMPNGSAPDKMATLIAIELNDCASQLDRILEGKPTEADGFRNG